jgi:hypothetical protein
MVMTDAEKAALVWLEIVISDPNAFEYAKESARALKAMLHRVAPADPEDRARWYVETFPV